MVSRLVSRDYEGRLKELGVTTMTERRHQTDMLHMYKVLNKKDKVLSDRWFDMAVNSQRAKHKAAEPLNMRKCAPWLEVRKHFFTQRVLEAWNKVLAALKCAATLTRFCQGTGERTC